MDGYFRLMMFWRRYRIILITYSVFALLIFYAAWLEGPKTVYQRYGNKSEWIPGIVFGIFKVSVIYYILIYQIALPFVRLNNWKTLLFKLVCFFTALTLLEYIMEFRMGDPTIARRMNTSLQEFIIWEIAIACFMILFTIAIAVYIELTQKKARESELEKQKLSAELAAIRYQINPHFLFNSLSLIFTKSVKENMEVANAVALLSEVMRYALEPEEDGQGKATLSKEIEHMNNVIAMNQMRYNNALRIESLIDVDNYLARIPRLMLITLVENAFKHGDLNDSDNPLDIKLSLKQGGFKFYIGNRIKPGFKELSSGIGLDNIRHRLALLYGSNQSFDIRQDDRFFIAEIKIDL
ncbi:histidine kinase [Mucilaginibacter roseus]|uniref:Histidine kinase n=1 Tax=Mucilaginibacter roseus TaxID=1528868 RepID=A0ABS8U090_9SPHI|nr:histidine kinase [Mucilaginibacter roseus]MCD8739349.1 histidine kinase [Mucilaginibacter roseus]